jgi:hypothetical protein
MVHPYELFHNEWKRTKKTPFVKKKGGGGRIKNEEYGAKVESAHN